jgi:hypothetical protein
MTGWTQVITHPLGLAGFALFLVFGYLAKVKRNDERRWISRAAVAAAVVGLAGGLIIAYAQILKPTIPSVRSAAPPVQQQTNQVQQSTTGPGSPAVQGVQGDVTITVDQSSGEAKPQKSAPKQPPAKSK